MSLHKTAIAISPSLLHQIDEGARARGESRNRFITAVLERAVRARQDALITRRLNDLFADERVAKEQVQAATDLDAASGQNWTEEGW